MAGLLPSCSSCKRVQAGCNVRAPCANVGITVANGTAYMENRFFFLNDEDNARVSQLSRTSQRYGIARLTVVTTWSPYPVARSGRSDKFGLHLDSDDAVLEVLRDVGDV